jgi:hypothetical protein
MENRRQLFPAVLRWLAVAATATLAVAGCGTRDRTDEHAMAAMPVASTGAAPASGGHADMGMVGEVADDAIGIDPTTYLASWNFSDLSANERPRFYKETRLDDGRLLRGFWFTALDREIEIAPGIHTEFSELGWMGMFEALPVEVAR